MTETPKRITELKLTEEPETEVRQSEPSIADLMRSMITQVGEDPNREGLRRTPERFERAFRYLTSGYQQDAAKILNGAIFSVCYDEMVVVKDIELFSLCEHHVLPFFGKCHVAYIPDKKVVGLSKIPRLVNMFSRRLQIQERLTNQIAQAIAEHDSSAGRGRGDRGAASVHGDARRGKAEFGDHHQRHAGRFSREPADPRGISLADRPPHTLVRAVFGLLIGAPPAGPRFEENVFMYSLRPCDTLLRSKRTRKRA